METVTPIPPAAGTVPVDAPVHRGRAALVGAVIGAALGLGGMALLVVVGTATGLAAHTAFALVIGPDGIFSPTGGAPFVWVVPPVAAGLAGALLAARARRRAPWAGVTMGYVTYALGIAIGPVFVLFLPSLESATAGSGGIGVLDATLGLLIGMGFLWLAGAVALAPLLVVCAAAGVAWAAALRAVFPASGAVRGVEPGSPGSGRGVTLATALVVIAGVLGFLWVLLTTFLQILVDSQAA
jgi:hypothetical protein